jgi:hypothetical protein
MASAQDLVSALQASHSNDKQARDQGSFRFYNRFCRVDDDTNASGPAWTHRALQRLFKLISIPVAFSLWLAASFCPSFTDPILIHAIATEYLMSNSGTPGLAPMMMDLISDASSDLLLRTSAAANLYSLIQRNWNAEVRPSEA